MSHLPLSTEPTPLRQVVRRMGRLLRDTEGSSSLIERFDLLTQLLACKAEVDRGELPDCFADGHALRAGYAALVRRWPERFRGHTTLRASDPTLTQLAALIGPLPAGPDLGLVYEEVIRNTFDKGENQQFFTPRSIIELMVAFVRPYLRGRVCDPCCGTGGFLRGAARDGVELFGAEVDERLAWAAGLNLLLHGAPATVRHLPGPGSLGPGLADWAGTMDVILTNPPFGSDFSDPAHLSDFQLGRNHAHRRRGVLFVERCLELLRPGGVMACVLDDGVLNGAGNTDVRALIRARADVLAVVSLPEVTFMPYASVKTSILVLQRRIGPVLARPTFFAQASEVGRRTSGEALYRVEHNRLVADDDLPVVEQAWGRFCAGAPAVGSGRVLAFAATLPRRPTERLDLPFHHPARAQAQAALAGTPYPVLRVEQLCTVRSTSRDPDTELTDEEFPYYGLAHIEAHTGHVHPQILTGSALRSTVARVEAGDLLFARMRPELRKICRAPVAGYASAECLVLVPRADAVGQPLMRPDLLEVLFRSELVYGQVIHAVTGIGRPRLSRAAILAVRLPVPPPDVQDQLWARFSTQMADADTLDTDAAHLHARAAHARQSAIVALATALVGPAAS